LTSFLRLRRLLFCFICCASAGIPAAIGAEVVVPFEKFVLDNGLTVLVHEDNKAPIVAVGVWYHVGSKDEPAGKTGFAHLFEHLMFEGSENHDAPFGTLLEQAGASSMNGTTWLDRTNYFETVPTPALDLALWLESDRMGHLLGVVTQEKLDRERAVVQNEKRQGDNQPYGKVDYRILEGVFPPGHPYRHAPIGSMADLDAASVEDIHAWFENYYGAANTILVLAGDIRPDRGRTLAEKYFGDIPSGPPLTRLKTWVPEKEDTVTETMHDKVPQARSYRVWAVPGWTSKDRLLLQLTASIMGEGKSSRLYQALVDELQFAVEVSTELQPFELASLFSIDTSLAPGASISQVSEILDHEMQLFLRDGPGEDELVRAQTRIRAGIIRGLERVGGFAGKATMLAQGELYDGTPDFYRTALSWIQQATTSDVLDASRRWLSAGYYQLDVLPFGDHRPSHAGIDRSTGPPQVSGLPDLRFPAIQRAQLTNGMDVVLAQRRSVPVVSIALQFDAGYAADAGLEQGTASLALAMMEESTRFHTAQEITRDAELLGAEITTSSDLDTSRLSLTALTENLENSVALFAEVVRAPAFAPDELERQRVRWLAGIATEKSQPLSVAMRTLPPLLYGATHPYGMPFTGSGTEESVSAITRDDLEAFYQEWFRPDNATIFVVGDTTLDQVLPLLETHFGDWQAPDEPLPEKTIYEVPLPGKARVILIDRPGSEQSLILAGHLAPPTGVEQNIEIMMMNDVFGGTYSARVNQSLRAERQWSYGASTLLPDARGQRPWIVFAPVQTDRTADSVRVLLEDMESFTGSRPATAEEMNRVFRSSVFSLPARYETSDAVLSALLSNSRFNRPDDYVSTLKTRYERVRLEDIRATANAVLRPDRITWVIVGDRSRIENDVTALGIAELEFMDNDGRLIE